jgi:hypothetical protein
MTAGEAWLIGGAALLVSLGFAEGRRQDVDQQDAGAGPTPGA